MRSIHLSLFLASFLFGCAPPPATPPAPEGEKLEIPLNCDEICSDEMSCSRRCMMDGEIITCGDYGLCGEGPPPPPPCNYVPASSPRTCGMDFDGHIWGTRIEIEEETLQRDTNGRCPDKYVQTVASRIDCVGVWGSTNTFNCCVDHLGTLCYYLQPGSCHR